MWGLLMLFNSSLLVQLVVCESVLGKICHNFPNKQSLRCVFVWSFYSESAYIKFFKKNARNFFLHHEWKIHMWNVVHGTRFLARRYPEFQKCPTESCLHTSTMPKSFCPHYQYYVNLFLFYFPHNCYWIKISNCRTWPDFNWLFRFLETNFEFFFICFVTPNRNIYDWSYSPKIDVEFQEF